VTRRVRRFSLSLVTLALVSASLVVLGRWEERTAVDEQLAGMRTAFTEAGGRIDSPQLTAYRLGDPDCLFYEVAKEPFAIELCFDKQGRLIEAADWLRPGGPRYWSLAKMPEQATIRADRRRLDELLQTLTG
jgi:hypothetical protein